MPIDRHFWQKYWFSPAVHPPWPCPTCGRASLALAKGSLHEASTSWTNRNQNDDRYEPECYRGRFTCMMICANPNCREAVSVAGDSEYGEEGEYGSPTTSFRPRMFLPPLNLFSIPKSCPDDVAKEIRVAFFQYWCDWSAMLNHLRTAVELILDHLKVPRSRMEKQKNGRNKKMRRSLHNRINEFRKKNPELADRLEAVKWLGNVGSHGKKATIEDVYDAFDLVEDFINEHFSGHGKRIRAMTQRINKKSRK